jgi:hypothetical protein
MNEAMENPKQFTHGQSIERVHWSKLKTVKNFTPYTFETYKDGKLKVRESNQLFSCKEWQAYTGDLPMRILQRK